MIAIFRRKSLEKQTLDTPFEKVKMTKPMYAFSAEEKKNMQMRLKRNCLNVFIETVKTGSRGRNLFQISFYCVLAESYHSYPLRGRPKVILCFLLFAKQTTASNINSGAEHTGSYSLS